MSNEEMKELKQQYALAVEKYRNLEKEFLASRKDKKALKQQILELENASKNKTV